MRDLFEGKCSPNSPDSKWGGKKKKNRNGFLKSEKDKFIFGVNSGEIVGGGEFGMNVEWV